MNYQEIFDRVSNHLLTQKKQALSEDGKCAYRSNNGLKCAVGCLIPDELYDSNLENNMVSDIKTTLEKSLGVEELGDKDLEFLDVLQFIHDCEFPDNWDFSLREFADDWNLNFKF